MEKDVSTESLAQTEEKASDIDGQLGMTLSLVNLLASIVREAIMCHPSHSPTPACPQNGKYKWRERRNIGRTTR